MEKFDAIYDFEISKDSFIHDEAKTHLCDYIKLAFNFTNESIDSFYYDKLEVLSELIDYIEGFDDTEKVEKLVQLQEQYYQMLIIREQNGGRPIPEKWKKWHKARYEIV